MLKAKKGVYALRPNTSFVISGLHKVMKKKRVTSLITHQLRLDNKMFSAASKLGHN